MRSTRQNSRLAGSLVPGSLQFGSISVRIKSAVRILVLAGLLAAGAAAADDGLWGSLSACELSAAGGRLTASALCGELEVPENPDEPHGRQLALAFAVKPAREKPRPDPIIFLAGGPGQSARELLPVMQASLHRLNRDRDLIFVDQRGTGGSNPLDCSFDQSDQPWLEPDSGDIDSRLRDCMSAWDAQPEFYTTPRAADDIDAFRHHYGIDSLNLIGGSYGTRVALVYLRNHPDRVRSVVLDGVVPTRLALGSEHAAKLDQALDKLFAACADDDLCGRAFPDLGNAFDSLKQYWRENSRRLIVTHPRTGEGVELDFNAGMLAAALRFLAYAPETQAIIPYLIHEASQTGNPERLAAQAMIVSDQMSEAISIGLNFAVSCSEDWPAWPQDIDQSGTLLGNSMTELTGQVCAWWPAGEVADDFHQPFKSDRPALLLSGELDPVTPPEYGDEVASQLENSVHLTAPGLGHIVMTNPCMSRLVTQFIQDNDPDSLDTECMQELGSTPFFLDLLGPAP